MSAGSAAVAAGTVVGKYNMGLVRVETTGSPGTTNFRFTSGPRRPGNIVTVVSPPKVIRTSTPGAGVKGPIFTIKPTKGMNGMVPEHDYSVKSRPVLVSGSVKLKELLLTQLDLIQKQSEAILKKDKQLQELQKENRELLSRLREFKEEGPPKKRRKLADKFTETSKDLLDPVKKSVKPHDSSREMKILETLQLYFTHNCEDTVLKEADEMREILSQSEVPQWRISPVSPSNESPREELDDEHMLMRHKKPELQEKQRKRWDMQRMRQLRQVEQLRRPTTEDGDSSSETTERIRTFYPDPSQIRQIICSDELPVCAFGHCLPDVPNLNFEWSCDFP